MNTLFTVAVFVGLSLATPGELRSLAGDPSCDVGLGVARLLLVLELVAFSSFLFSNFVTQGLKLALDLARFASPCSPPPSAPSSRSASARSAAPPTALLPRPPPASSPPRSPSTSAPSSTPLPTDELTLMSSMDSLNGRRSDESIFVPPAGEMQQNRGHHSWEVAYCPISRQHGGRTHSLFPGDASLPLHPSGVASDPRNHSRSLPPSLSSRSLHETVADLRRALHGGPGDGRAEADQRQAGLRTQDSGQENIPSSFSVSSSTYST
uniref:DUF4220 domain-containing protein n=1 Tax=Oryza brachyantha TaxID=4533 RepID=J3NB39_ORYBR